jgi:hypothetical protein
MANMSHCRFRNTLTDLHDCEEHMGDRVEGECCTPPEEDDGYCECESLSKKEAQARLSLIRLCRDISDNFGYLLEYED